MVTHRKTLRSLLCSKLRIIQSRRRPLLPKLLHLTATLSLQQLLHLLLRQLWGWGTHRGTHKLPHLLHWLKTLHLPGLLHHLLLHWLKTLLRLHLPGLLELTTQPTYTSLKSAECHLTRLYAENAERHIA